MEEDERENNNVRKTKKIKPLIAGVLLITAGIIGMMMSAPILLINDETIDYIRDTNDLFEETFQNVTTSQLKQSFMMIGAIGVIFSLFGFIGGTLSIFRKKWMITLILSIISIFSILFLILPGILSIIAVILIYLSKNDFKDTKNVEIEE